MVPILNIYGPDIEYNGPDIEYNSSDIEYNSLRTGIRFSHLLEP